MSYILKALRKSEAERAKGMVPRLTTRHEPEPPPRRRLWPALAGGALVANLGLVALVLWQPGILPGQGRSDRLAAGEPGRAALQPAAETVAPLAIGRQVASLKAAGEPIPAEARPSAGEAAPSEAPAVLEPAAAPVGHESAPESAAEPRPEAVAQPPAVERAAPEATTPEKIVAEAIVAEEPLPEEAVAEERVSEQAAPVEIAAEAPPLPKAKPAAVALLAKRTIRNRAEEGLARRDPVGDQLAWAAPLAEVPAPPPPSEPPDLFADVPELWRMSQAFRESVPDMTISVHVYSPDERRRFIIVDRRKYWEGDRLDGGVVLEAILPQGVVFNLNGQQFKLTSG